MHEAGAAEVALRITAALGTALRFILCEELMHHSSAAAEAPAVPRVVILAEDRAWREPGPMTACLQKPFEMKTMVGLALSMLS